MTGVSDEDAPYCFLHLQKKQMITYEQIKPYVEKGLISEQSHPDDSNVRIFNYTHTCQFDKAWDEITMQCRGLIMNVATGEILAKPFPKFFNYQEYIDNGGKVPKGIPFTTEKMDGSLGIMYVLNGEVWIATRGAFTSDQAIWATKWWRLGYGSKPLDKPIECQFRGTNVTRLFEIIYPANRIVVNYDFEGLVHIASLETETGELVSDKQYGIKKVKSVGAYAPEELMKLEEPNSEGFVLFYPDENLRLKIKFPEYVRLHRLVTGLSEIAIWEFIKEGKTVDDLLEKVPDEFYKWVNSVEIELRRKFAEIWQPAQLALLTTYGMATQKEKALWIMENAKDIQGVVFFLINGRNEKAAEPVWKMVRPHGASQFKNDPDA